MAAHPDSDPFVQKRLNMVEVQLRKRGIRDQEVLRAMARVPRHEFVAPPLRRAAYDDIALPIGEGQTVSQPFIVAFMLEALEITSEHRVLEVGTGTGYQAALLGELAQKVFTVERQPLLADAARTILTRLGHANIEVFTGDGTQGLARHGPFDRIIVAAAAPYVPPALIAQLEEGGRMVIPVGSSEAQELQLVRKENRYITAHRLEGCRFVLLIGEQGFAGE